MKKVIIGIFVLIGICSMSLKADVEDMVEMMKAEISQHSFGLVEKGKSVETHFVKYAVATDGSLMHFGVWTDCIIGTVVANANNIGTQMIMLPSGDIIDGSTDYSVHSKYFVNKYSWGKIYSYENKQVIERK